jgi:hypothetical protein
LVAKLSVVAVFADRFLLEERLALAFSDAAPLEELVPVCDAFLVALPATAPSDALVVLDELPLPAEVAGVLEELLLKDEVPVLVAVPFAPAAAKFRVPFEADVLLFALVWFADAPNVAAADFELLAVRAPLVAKLFVVAPDLLEFSAAAFVTALFSLALVTKAFVVPLDLLELADAEADSFAEAVLLALACCMLLLLAAKLCVELAVFELSSVNDEVWLAD